MKSPQYHRIFNYDRRLLPNRYLAKLERDVEGIEAAQARSGKTLGYPGWGVLYYLLLSHLKPDEPNTILETGTNQGASTLVLAQALVDSGRPGKVLTVELNKANYAKALQTFERGGLSDRIVAVCGNSLEELPKMLAGQPPVRFAFLDASHEYRDVLTEFEMVLPYLDRRALVLFDNTYPIADTGEDPRVYGALKEIRRRHGGNLVNLEFVSWFTPGLAIWQHEPLVEG